MSYNVAILKMPVPEDDAQAWNTLGEVARRPAEGEVPHVFHQLIDRLTERYPCICDLSDDDVNDGAWSDGPLRNNATPNMTVLGIVSSKVQEVQPFVVETATSLGLVVFDEQAGAIYRPGHGASSGSPKAGKPWWKFWA